METWAWGAQPDEWIETDWIDENGNYHTIEEIGVLVKVMTTEDDEDIPF